MAVSLQTHVDKIDTAISNLLDAIDSDGMMEYEYRGRKFRRFEFDRLLTSLLDAKERLEQRLSRANNNPVRLGKLGRARGVDR